MEPEVGQNNHQEELGELHAASFSWAMTCCRGDATAAEDALQATYVKVLTGGARFGGRSTFKTWLFAVIRNTAREQARKRLKRSLLLGRWFESNPVVESTEAHQREDLESGRTRALVQRALERLSEKQRHVLELVFYHDLTLEEAAGVLDMKLGTARTHYARGKKQMLKHLEAQPDFEWEPT